MIHKLFEMYKQVTKVFELFVAGDSHEPLGTRSFIKRKNGFYLCRFLDLFGNHIESYIHLGNIDLSKGIIMTSISPNRLFSCIAYSTSVKSLHQDLKLLSFQV